MSGPYDDIIDLPRPVPQRHPRMPMANRAAQFMPFRALTGYEDTVWEAARQTDAKAELTEDEKALLDTQLQALAERASGRPEITLTYFQPDTRKAGGAYVSVTGRLLKIDRHEGTLTLLSGERIQIENILAVQAAGPSSAGGPEA